MGNKFYKDVITKHFADAATVQYVLATGKHNVILGDEEKNRQDFKVSEYFIKDTTDATLYPECGAEDQKFLLDTIKEHRVNFIRNHRSLVTDPSTSNSTFTFEVYDCVSKTNKTTQFVSAPINLATAVMPRA